MTDAREQAEQALLRAGALGAKTTGEQQATVKALTGIGYALLYIGDMIKGDRNKYEPPF